MKILFMASPLAMVMLPVRKPMSTSAVANQGRPSIMWGPSNLIFGLITKKSARYSHKSTKTRMSCNIPSSLITDLSASSSKVDVGSNIVIPNFSPVSVVKMLMATPKSTNLFEKEWP